MQIKNERGAATPRQSWMDGHFFGLVWDRALPADVLLSLLVRPSRRTLDAAEAAVALVCLVFCFDNLITTLTF